MTDLRPRAIPDGPVIFDCDGTLVSTEGAWDKAYATLFAQHQRKLARPDRHRLVGLTRIDLGHELARLLDLPGQHTALGDQVIALVTSNHGQGITAMPGVAGLLPTLARQRLLGVASNTLRDIVEQYLIQLQLADLFTVIASSDTVAAPNPPPTCTSTRANNSGPTHEPPSPSKIPNSAPRLPERPASTSSAYPPNRTCPYLPRTSCSPASPTRDYGTCSSFPAMHGRPPDPAGAAS